MHVNPLHPPNLQYLPFLCYIINTSTAKFLYKRVCTYVLCKCRFPNVSARTSPNLRKQRANNFEAP